jgi:hypothetical protein
VIDCEIDPYAEEQSINDAVKGVISKIGKLHGEYD